MFTASTITAAILEANPPGASLSGVVFTKLAVATGQAIDMWLRAGGVVMAGVTTGMAGSGVVQGVLTVPPAVPTVHAALLGVGVGGVLSLPLAYAVSVGTSRAMATAQYTGPSVGVGTGADISKVVAANPVTLAALLAAQIPAVAGGAGLLAPYLAQGLATGVASQFMFGAGTGVVAGPSGPVPGVGASPSSILF